MSSLGILLYQEGPSSSSRFFEFADGESRLCCHRRRFTSTLTSCPSRCHEQIQDDEFDKIFVKCYPNSQRYYALACFIVHDGSSPSCAHLLRGLGMTRQLLGFWGASIFWTTKRLRIAGADAAPSDFWRKPEWQSFTFILHLQRVPENDVKMILKIDNSYHQTAFLKRDLFIRSELLIDGGWSGKCEFGVCLWWSRLVIRTRILVTANW